MMCTHKTKFCAIFSILLAAVLPMIIPLLHFGVIYRLWDQYDYSVDTKKCRNSCWDTIYKGNNLLKKL